MKLSLCYNCNERYAKNFIAGAHFDCKMCERPFYSLNACDQICVPCSKIASEEGKCPCCGEPMSPKGR